MLKETKICDKELRKNDNKLVEEKPTTLKFQGVIAAQRGISE